MPTISANYFRAAITFLVIGICFGLYMSISADHSYTGVHAHLNLVGWATSALFGTYFALNHAKAQTRLANIQFWIFMIGTIIMTVSLALLLGGNMSMVPAVAAGSIIAFIGVLIFGFIVWK